MCQAKQHKKKFSKDASCRTKCHLEVVYSDVYGPMKVDLIDDNRYIITFIYYHSIKLWTCLVNRKNEVF